MVRKEGGELSRRDGRIGPRGRTWQASSTAVGAAAGALAFVLFGLTLCPTVPFGDGGDLIVGSADLGIVHPPGYPLYTLIAWLALKIPIGEPALRTNLLSAVFGAIACGLLASFLHRRTKSTAGSLAAGLGFAASSTFWGAATVTEVYSLHLLVVVGLLEASAAAGEAGEGPWRGRALVRAALWVGLGLAHHPTIVLAVPAAVVLAWPARGNKAMGRARAPARVGLLLPAVALGLPALFYGSLLLRARMAEGPAWGKPRTVAALWAHASASGYRFHDLGMAGVLRPEGWSSLGGLVLEDGAYVTLALAVVGLGFAGRFEARLRAAASILAGAHALFFLRYAAEDAEVYFLPGTLALSLLAGLGIAGLERRAPVGRTVAGSVAAAVAVLVPIAKNFPDHDLRTMTAAADYGRDILASVPFGGILFVEGDDLFPLAYLTRILGERPDVTLYDRNGQLLRDLASEPGPPPRAGESPDSYRLRREIERIRFETESGSGRAVCFAMWPGYELPGGLRFEPVGLVYEIRRASDPPRDDRPVWARTHEPEVVREALRVGGSFAIAVAATYPLMRGERELFLGEVARAEAAFEEARGIGADNETVRNTLGVIYARQGRYDRAAEEFEAAIRAKPVSLRAWKNLGRARWLLGDRDGARRAYRRCLELDPGQEEAAQALRALGGAF